MADPASLEAQVGITGMTPSEAAVAFANLPAGSTAEVRVTKPGIGGKRYAIIARDLSILAAKDLTTSVFMHCDAVLNGTDGGAS